MKFFGGLKDNANAPDMLFSGRLSNIAKGLDDLAWKTNELNFFFLAGDVKCRLDSTVKQP